ncbi:phospholipase D family protein [Blautia sp.]
MFRPDSNRDRRDYSSILMPPDGYRLYRAVGTTYSLDLEALTAVAICLGLAEDTDSKLMQNPIGMLNALQKVSDKVVLFCEAGQIKVPSKPTALSILLEKMVVEVALPKDEQLGQYSAFHPKTWVLAYENGDGDKKYRFVVMSRNLTFDRSWDICFAMDSSKSVSQKKKTKPICDFLNYLAGEVPDTSANAEKKRNLIRGMKAELTDVSFALESRIFGENFEVLPLGIGKTAYQMKDDILFCKKRGDANSTFNELIVMSPFLSERVIADFNLSDRALAECERTLITRRSELGKLKVSDVDHFNIYVLKDEIIDGEDEISDELADKKKQDIHAKIYLRRKYSNVDLYLGSMNASYSAINKNVEMMLRLGTKNMYLNGTKFLEDIFCGLADNKENPFEKVAVSDAALETERDNRNLLEQKIKELCRVNRQAVIFADAENVGKYKIVIEFSGIEYDSEITVSPIQSKQEQILAEHIEFSELEIMQLSEFYEITVKSGEDTIRRIIMIPTSGFPEERESAVVNSVVKDRASFVEYIAFVLGEDHIGSILEGKQMGESGFFRNSSNAMPALYEKMLKASVEEPERIKDIGYVLKMVTNKEIIPDEFRRLYETFCNTLKIRR